MSPLTGSPRGAADPINAILNYLYGLLEAESRIALSMVGLDPGVGILHTDQRARDSLALDLMEAARPAVDRYLLDLLAKRRFAAADFAETRVGQCRVMLRLARDIAHTSLTWAAEVAPYAEMIASRLAANASISAPPTLLTGDARRAGRPAEHRRDFRPLKPPIALVCQDCGAGIPDGRKRCRACHQTANAERVRAHQADEITRRRETGNYPSKQPAVRARIAETQRAHGAARRENPPSSGFTGHPSEFRRLILPRLAGLAPRDLARQTGLSPGYCAQVRDGKRVPHVRHWPVFQLAGLLERDRSTT